MTVPIIEQQRRLMEIGRVRLGEKGPKGEPRKRKTFRLTSADEKYVRDAAAHYGGSVEPWNDPMTDDRWQVCTEASELAIVFPPLRQAPYSQFYELYKGGGCLRRCDGENLLGGAELGEAASRPCACNAEARVCSLTTRISFMLPEVVGFGRWRLDSHGWNAALELPGTIEVLMLAALQGQFIKATLRIEERMKKVPGEGTRRFVVPVIDLPETRIGDMLPAGEGLLTIPRASEPTVRAALPAAPELPAEPGFEQNAEPEFGPAPPLDETARPSLAAGIALQVQRKRLLDAADRLGKREQTERRIDKHAAEHDPAEHAAWLGTQAERAEAKVAQPEEARA